MTKDSDECRIENIPIGRSDRSRREGRHAVCIKNVVDIEIGGWDEEEGKVYNLSRFQRQLKERERKKKRRKRKRRAEEV